MHLVELCGTGHYFAMKAMDKGVMLNRNKVLKSMILCVLITLPYALFGVKFLGTEIHDFMQVHRACAEREILDILDHPFLPALYASFQVSKNG